MARRSGLSTKYALLIAGLVTLVLVASSGLALYFSGKETLARLAELHSEKAHAAAARIELYIRDIEHQLGWTALPRPQPGGAGLEQRRWEFLKLLRQVPAITELTWLDGLGRERLRISRLAMDRANAGTDYSRAPFFTQVDRGRPYYSSVTFRNGSEPSMTIARSAGEPGDGVVVAEVNLKFVWDVVSHIQVGHSGQAFVVDSSGKLIAHPDISLVLQNTTLAFLPHVAELLRRAPEAADGGGRLVRNHSGQQVLSASAPIGGLGWHVLVEMPREEALEPVYASIVRGLLVLVAGVLVAVIASVLLARRMVKPVLALQAGAQAIGAGHLDQHIEVATGDELETLATEFNTMSSRLQESYATLEQKVAQRTGELTAQRRRAETASLAKTRFLAAASHDLRQPMHALNLYVGALAGMDLAPAARQVLANVRQCAHSMDDLLDGLLDISRLDANAVEADVRSFCIAAVLEHVRVEWTPPARAKGLQLRVVPCSAWVRSDAALVERIVRNLVSNAVRHTHRGRVLVGCRRVGACVRLAVHDTGPGIAPDQQELVFEEFYQLANPERDREKGLGLGLAIVRRLGQLLGAPLTLVSSPGRGSMFAIDLPLSAALEMEPHGATSDTPTASLEGALIVVVDDESAVLNATRTLLQQWGCTVVTAASGGQAVEALGGVARAPDVLICDYRLRAGENGLAVIELLRDEFNRQIPALIISGDAGAEQLWSHRPADVVVLRKPVAASTLRNAIEEVARPASWQGQTVSCWQGT